MGGVKETDRCVILCRGLKSSDFDLAMSRTLDLCFDSMRQAIRGENQSIENFSNIRVTIILFFMFLSSIKLHNKNETVNINVQNIWLM